MTSYELRKAYNTLLSSFKENEYALQTAFIASRHRTELAGQLGSVVEASGQAAAWQKLNEVKERLKKAAAELRGRKSGTVFIELDRLRAALANLPGSLHEPGADELTAHLGTFYSAYERFLNRDNQSNSLELLAAGQAVATSVDVAKSNAHVVLTGIRVPDVPPTSNERLLEIVLLAPSDYERFLSKAKSIHDVYEEVAAVIGVSVSEYPLRIARVESGSLWVRVFGEARVVATLIGLLERALGYLYRTFTNEGKLAAVPRSVAAVDEILGLTTRLEAAGCNTEQLKPQIEKAALKIAQNISNIVDGEPAVEINGSIYSLSDELRGQYLEASRHRRIESGQSALDPD